ncbi:MAG TPA: cobalamin biosynthesis protein [Sporichthyaceae bacterium]
MTRGSKARALGLAVGCLLDAVFADPRRGHPVAGFGRLAGGLERRCRRDSRAAGLGYTSLAVAGPVVLGIAVERVTAGRPLARMAGTALATWTVLGGTSLARQGVAMAAALDRDDLPAARARLSHLCARNPDGLGAPELARATVESVAENTGDAVVAPLCWGALAGVPGLLGYRAVNTLDAMVGYRDERYRRFGTAAARLDDVANLLPARLTGLLTVALAPGVGGAPAATVAVLRADRGAHPSPNAGWCEAAAAGALGVRLGGSNSYPGYVEDRPLLNASGRAPQPADIGRAVRLSRLVGAAAAGLAVVAAGARA